MIFGGLLGFVIAHQIYAGRTAPVMPPPPAAAAGPARPGPADPHQGTSEGTMDSLTQELQALKQAVQEDPSNVGALDRLAELYMEAAMYDQAAGFLRQALEVDEEDVHVRTDLATCLLMQGKGSEAVAEFERAVQSDPGHGRTWYGLGFAYVETAQYDKGEEAFEKALELNPGSFDLEAMRAEIEKLKQTRSEESSGGSPS